MRTSFVATTSTAPTSDDLHGATIGHRDHTTNLGPRVASHRRGAAIIIATTCKIGSQSEPGASHRHSKTGTSVNQLQQRHHSTNKYSGASR